MRHYIKAQNHLAIIFGTGIFIRKNDTNHKRMIIRDVSNANRFVRTTIRIIVHYISICAVCAGWDNLNTFKFESLRELSEICNVVPATQPCNRRTKSVNIRISSVKIGIFRKGRILIKFKSNLLYIVTAIFCP